METVKKDNGEDTGKFYQNSMSAAISSKPNLHKTARESHEGRTVTCDPIHTTLNVLCTR